MRDRKLSSNMEDYLEAIAALKKENDVVRVRDISQSIGVKSSSVNAALKTLSGKGYVDHERYGYVKLTPDGEEVAGNIQSKHDALLKFLSTVLGINKGIASEDACKMEHAISSQTFSKLAKFMQFVEGDLNGKKPEWLKGFNYYIKTGKRPKCKMRELATEKKEP